MLKKAHNIYFRYDAPTMIVAIKWHLTRTNFGRFLYDRLSFSYAGRPESVQVSFTTQNVIFNFIRPIADVVGHHSRW